MAQPIILASSSPIRSELLVNAGIKHEVVPARIDEATTIHSLLHASEPPRNIADALAEAKALKISAKHPDAFVIGSDQVLSHRGAILQKAASKDELIDQIEGMTGGTHSLWSAAVIAQGGEPVWRHVGRVDLTMHAMHRDEIRNYVFQNWDAIQYCVGGYRFEAEGLRLFSRVQGDYFHILGFPLLEVVNYLRIRGLLT